jgi:hypothetical protein
MSVNPSYPHIHNLLVSLPQTPSLAYRRCHSLFTHISYKLTGVRLLVSSSKANNRVTIDLMRACSSTLYYIMTP